jgi:hypothetical protein|tara:strand:- start:109 stop:273 length:165 start_codon:yes stop_codon:yes gene_type:complete
MSKKKGRRRETYKKKRIKRKKATEEILEKELEKRVSRDSSTRPRKKINERTECN